jgi:hypothetical protein
MIRFIWQIDSLQVGLTESRRGFAASSFEAVQRVLLKLGSEQERPCLRAVEGAQLVRIRLTEIKEMLYTAQRVGLRLYIK